MAELLQVELSTAEKRPFSFEANEVVAPGACGVFAVLPGHTPFLTALGPGVVIVYEAHGGERHFAVSGGFAEVLDDKVTVLADTFEEGDAVDVERAQEARDRAERRLSKPEEDTDVRRAERALDRALARISAANRLGY